MALASKFGPAYEAIRAAARIKSIKVQLNDIEHELKVRVPVKRELEEMLQAIHTPPKERVEKAYETMTGSLKTAVQDLDAEVMDALNSNEDQLKITDNDVIVNGTSMRQVASMTAMWQEQVERYFSLLQSSTGEPVTETFEEIAEEFPEAIIREIVGKIDKAIRPTYEETKKN